MFFKKKPPPIVKTNGYYHFRQKRKTDQGEPIQIDYSLIFKEIANHDNEYSHFAYINFQINKTQLDTSLIRSAFYQIKNSDSYPEEFEQMLCKTDKQFIEFADDRMIESVRMGQKNVFKGMFFEDSMILRYLLFGFDYSGNSVSAINFSDSMFKFYGLEP